MILIFDPANDRNIEIIGSKLQTESEVVYFDFKEINKHLEEVVQKIVDHEVDAVICHAGGSGSVSLDMASVNIESLGSLNVAKNCLIYLSSGVGDYLAQAREKGLRITDTPYEFKKQVTKIHEHGNLSWVNSILEYCKKKLSKTFDAYFLRLFLPLDIDMQALADDRVTDKKKYLQEMFADATEVDFYKNKLSNCHSEASKFIEQMPDENNKTKLKTLLGIDNKETSCIYNFLNLLDITKGKTLEKKDIDAVLKYFEQCCNDGYYKDINSFHDWYCALAECLRGEKVLK